MINGYQSGDGFAWWHSADGGAARQHDPESQDGRGCSSEGHDGGDGFSRGTAPDGGNSWLQLAVRSGDGPW